MARTSGGSPRSTAVPEIFVHSSSSAVSGDDSTTAIKKYAAPGPTSAGHPAHPEPPNADLELELRITAGSPPKSVAFGSRGFGSPVRWPAFMKFLMQLDPSSQGNLKHFQIKITDARGDFRRVEADSKNVVSAINRCHEAGWKSVGIKAHRPEMAFSYQVASSVRTRLTQELYGARIRSGIGRNYFIPADRLRKILSCDNILALLKEDRAMRAIAADGLEDIAEDISQDHYKLLGTFLLSHVESLELFDIFWAEGFCDAKMPLGPDDVNHLSSNRVQLDRIRDFQFQTIAPVLEFGALADFVPDIVLPFESALELSSGAFGKVDRVKIPPAHQQLYKTTREDNPALALKELTCGDNNRKKGDLKREAEILHRIRELEHRHLIRLLNAFSHGDRCYFLFPLADYTLNDVFRKHDPRNDTSLTEWIISQFCGLADGLHALHKPKFSDTLSVNQEKLWHHDIKPENILVFLVIDEILTRLEARHGVVVLCDFGLAKLQVQVTGMTSAMTEHQKGSRPYAAPESDHKNGKVSQSRPYDIWSFGCVLFEVLIWLSEGPHGVETFKSARVGPDQAENDTVETNTYYFFAEGQPKLRDCVKAKMKRLKENAIDDSEQGPVSKALTLVKQCLHIDKKGRPDAEKVKAELESIRRSLPKNSRLFY